MSMQHKTVLITGATSGIGFATAAGLARMGAHVIVVARDVERGEAARAAIQRMAPEGDANLLLADLSVQSDVRWLAAEVGRRFSRLDVLINNAAIIPPQRETTVDGIERQLAVNHLAPFLLTNLLLDQLRWSGPSRIVTVASATHTQGRVDFDDLQHEHQYHVPRYPIAGWQAYCNTKLMNIMFTRELARRLAGTNVSANCLHPGVVATELVRSWPGWARTLYKMFMPGPERGARASIFLASSPTIAGVTGKYVDQNCKIAEPSPLARDAVAARRLWDVSAELVGLNMPTVSSVVGFNQRHTQHQEAWT